MIQMQRQVSVINTFYLKSLSSGEPKIARLMSADIAKAILSKRFVFVLKINILPDIDEDSFDKFDEENVDIINSFWYNNISTVGQIRLLQFILKSIFLNIFFTVNLGMS